MLVLQAQDVLIPLLYALGYPLTLTPTLTLLKLT